MRILLDTHFILWFLKGDERMPGKLLALVQDSRNTVHVSDVSILEVAIKHAKNPSAMPYSGVEVADLCDRVGFQRVPLSLEAIFAYEHLDFESVGNRHRDLFDRLLISQSKAGNLLLATHDDKLALYGELLVSVF